MSAIILRDEIVHYEVLGRGRPTLFLHDWVGSWRYWIPCMQAASVSFRAYALDLWGFGDTAKNPSYYSIDQQLSLLEEFLEELGIGKIAVVGHGLGAVLALLYAARRPGNVDRILAVSLPPKESAIQPRLRLAPPAELADWLLGRTPATEAAWLEACKADPRAIALSLVSLQSMDLAALPTRAQAPCLIVHGLDDPAVIPTARRAGSKPAGSGARHPPRSLRALPHARRPGPLQPPADGFPGFALWRQPAAAAAQRGVEEESAVKVETP